MSLLGNLAGGIGKLAGVASFIPGPIGAAARGIYAASSIVGAVSGGGGRTPLPPSTAAAGLPAMPGGGRGTALVKAGGALVSAGAGAVRRFAGSPGGKKLGALVSAGVDLTGAYYIGKSLFASDGTKLLTNRTMNPMNHRALRRAIRRVKGAKRLAREVEKITHHCKRR